MSLLVCLPFFIFLLCHCMTVVHTWNNFIHLQIVWSLWLWSVIFVWLILLHSLVILFSSDIWWNGLINCFPCSVRRQLACWIWVKIWNGNNKGIQLELKRNSLSIWLKKKSFLDQLIFYLHQCALKLAACDAIAELAQHTYLLHSENECHLLIVGVVSSADNQSS